MHPLVIPSACLIAGIYFFARNIFFLTNQEKLENYLTTSPKGKIWVSKFGKEKTAYLARKFFLPLGLVIAVVLAGVGGWGLFKLIPGYL